MATSTYYEKAMSSRGRGTKPSYRQLALALVVANSELALGLASFGGHVGLLRGGLFVLAASLAGMAVILSAPGIKKI
jgi:hypothetical protein